MTVPAASFYKIDTRKLSLSEYWAMAPGPGFLVLLLLKLLRIPLDLKRALPYPDRFVRADESDLDRDGRRARVRRSMEALEGAGFRRFGLRRNPSIDPNGSHIGMLYQSVDDTSYAAVIDSVARGGKVTVRQTALGLVSRLSGGRFLVTSNDRKGFQAPPGVLAEVPRARKPAQLIARHAERVHEHGGAERLLSEDLEGIVMEFERRLFDYTIERGVLVEMAPEAVDKLRNAKPHSGGGGGLLRWAFAFGVGPMVFLASLGFSMFGWPGIDEGDFWYETTPAVLQCVDRSGAVEAEGDVDGPLLAAVFEAEQPARQAFEQMRDSLSESLVMSSWESVVFVRSEAGDRSLLKPTAQQLDALGARLLMDDEENGYSLALQVRWNENSKPASTNDIAGYLSAPVESHLVAPWAPKAELTETQLRARGSYFRLANEPMPGMFDAVKQIVAIWLSSDDDFDDYFAADRTQAKKRVDELVQAGDADRETADLYLEWYDSIYSAWDETGDPFEEEGENAAGGDVERALGAHLGALDVTNGDTSADPRSRYTALGGWTSVDDDGTTGIVGIIFHDVAAGVPAFMEHLCESGVDSVEWELSGRELELSSAS